MSNNKIHKKAVVMGDIPKDLEIGKDSILITDLDTTLSTSRAIGVGAKVHDALKSESDTKLQKILRFFRLLK